MDGHYFHGSQVVGACAKEHIRYKGKPFYLNSMDREAMNVFAHAFRHSFIKAKEYMLLYPWGSFSLAPLMAVEAFSITSRPGKDGVRGSDFVRTWPQYRERDCVLLITKDMSIRSAYEHLHIYGAERVKKSREMYKSLNYYWLRIGVVKFDGSAQPIKYCSYEEKTEKGLPDTHFLLSSSFDALPNSGFARSTSVVMAELPDSMEVERLTGFRKWCADSEIPLTVFIVRTLRSRAAESLTAAGVPVFGWSASNMPVSYKSLLSEELKRIPGNYCPPFHREDAWRHLRCIAEGAELVIAPVDEPTLNSKLVETRKFCMKLRKDSRKGPSQARFVNCLDNAVKALEDMTAPLEFCERLLNSAWRAKTIQRRFVELESYARTAGGADPSAASFMKLAIERLESLGSYMKETRSGKPVLMEEAVRLALDKGERLCVVNKTRTLSNAAIQYLESRGLPHHTLLESGIELKVQPRLQASESIDSILYFGIPSYDGLAMLDIPYAPKVTFMLYESELPLFYWLLNKGFRDASAWDREGILRNLSGITGISSVQFQADGLLDGYARMPAVCPTSLELQNSQVHAESPAPAPLLEFEHGMTMDSYIRAEEESANEDTLTAEHRAGGEEAPSGGGQVYCYKIYLDSTRHMFVPVGRDMDVYDRVRNKTESKTCRDIHEGDFILLVNNSTRQGIANAIVMSLRENPNDEIAGIVYYHDAWREAIENGLEEIGYTREMLSSDLFDLDLGRTPQEITLWIHGKVIGPNSREIIRVIGLILGSELLENRYEKIWAAMNFLRGIKRQLTPKLLYYAKKHFIMELGGQTSTDEIISEELNLYLSDFKGMITLERVERIEGPFYIDLSIVDKIRETS